ncbi:hypothetical protein ACKXGF_07365 [Alkalibacillus sp. S2W]|uniref:hypothetical protein n=1 Tax=Alkalibacillus sp. S2W TaxID=3386553 RepID=UPI00398D48B7
MDLLKLIETDTFLITLTIIPIIFGATITFLYNRLELAEAFYTPERVNTAYFDTKKQQRFYNKYKNRLEERHLNILNNELVRKRAIKTLHNTSC